MVMVNLGSTDNSRYTGYREITDRDVLDLQCIFLISPQKHMLWVLIRSTSASASKEYPQHMFLWRNKKNTNTFGLKKKNILLGAIALLAGLHSAVDNVPNCRSSGCKFISQLDHIQGLP